MVAVLIVDVAMADADLDGYEEEAEVCVCVVKGGLESVLGKGCYSVCLCVVSFVTRVLAMVRFENRYMY